MKLTNTILANGTAGGNCAGTIKDGGHNLDDGTTCGFGSAKHSLSSTDPMLDPAGLADNGGPTQTIAVESGSPAIDVATCAPHTDQRGYKRPGIDSTTGNPYKHCTIGAYEFNSPGCPSGQTVCDSVCTNLMKDPNNCGTCSTVCAAGQKC